MPIHNGDSIPFLSVAILIVIGLSAQIFCFPLAFPNWFHIEACTRDIHSISPQQDLYAALTFHHSIPIFRYRNDTPELNRILNFSLSLLLTRWSTCRTAVISYLFHGENYFLSTHHSYRSPPGRSTPKTTNPKINLPWFDFRYWRTSNG